MQPAAHILDPGAKTRQGVRFEIDVAEFDRAGAGGADQPVVLPVDAGVTDRTLGVVLDRELRAHAIAAIVVAERW
jgi:hypothetical protein